MAVATEANQVVAASVSGALAHWRRRNVDIKMGLILLAGGFVGSSLGVWLFTALRGIGQIDFVISVAYVVFLGIIGVLMVIESFRAWQRRRNPAAPRRRLHQHYWVHGLPLKMRFRRPSSISARCCRFRSGSSSACSPPSWASAAAS